MGNRVFVCSLSCWVGSYLHLILCFNLPYFLANSSTYLFEKIKNTHYLELFSVAYQKGTSACPIARNGICSCSFSVFQSGSFSSFSSHEHSHEHFCTLIRLFPFAHNPLPSPHLARSCSSGSVHFKFHLSCDASLEHPRPVVPKCLECLYQKKPQKQQQKLKTSFVEPHRDGHYFWKEITFLHQKAGGIWCQFNDSFKKWIKYIYMERTLYCPFSPTSFC